MQEFICPNGKMSVNGVCPMFENDVSQQIENFENNPFKKSFQFDFEKETPSSKKSAFDIIGENINAYDSYVQDRLGISPGVQNVARIGATIATGSLMPFAIPFVAGGALKAADNRRVQNITMQDPQGDIQTTPARIMNIQPTPQDIYRGGGGGGSTQSKDSIGSRGSGMSGYGGGADMGGGSPGSSGPGGSDSMGSF